MITAVACYGVSNVAAHIASLEDAAESLATKEARGTGARRTDW